MSDPTEPVENKITVTHEGLSIKVANKGKQAVKIEGEHFRVAVIAPGESIDLTIDALKGIDPVQIEMTWVDLNWEGQND